MQQTTFASHYFCTTLFWFQVFSEGGAGNDSTPQCMLCRQLTNVTQHNFSTTWDWWLVAINVSLQSLCIHCNIMLTSFIWRHSFSLVLLSRQLTKHDNRDHTICLVPCNEEIQLNWTGESVWDQIMYRRRASSVLAKCYCMWMPLHA